jgi:hypothetical protein
VTAPAPHPPPAGRARDERSDRKLILLVGLALFVLGAWPLLLVELPPLQDLPNHVATAHIIAHPALYPEFTFNGLFKSNALLTLWFSLFGNLGLFGAARAFTALVLAANAFALPLFVAHFGGRRALLTAAFFLWPLVHSFSVAMGFLNFAFGFALSLLLLTLLDGMRERPTVARGAAVAAVAGLVWYAHPFPLAIVGVLVAMDVLSRRGWPARVRAGLTLLLPLLPAGLLAVLSAQRHLVKAEHAPPLGSFAYLYLNPLETLEHLWLDVSGALTWWGSATVIPAVVLPYCAWKNRRRTSSVPADGSAASFWRAPSFFSAAALVVLAAVYVALPTMLSNWYYLNCRLVPFLWIGLLVRLPARVPRPLLVVLGVAALWFSATLGVDYRRLAHDDAEFAAGIDAVPDHATLLPLLFKHRKTSVFTASLTHDWGYYTVAKDTSAPLVFGVERSYPITYRQFPPRQLIPPAFDRFAERYGTPAQVCKILGQVAVDAACTAAWRDLWRGFWRDAEPRFSHVLTWALPDEARAIIPETYRRVFAQGELEIYAATRGNR